MNNKKLSIIIPVYNVEEYISRCLDSIYTQNIDEKYFEVITVDDGTKDNSVEIIKRYQEKHKNLILFSQENTGLSGARNAGLKLASGEYIWFVDSDDWLTDKALETVFNVIERKYDVISTTLIYSYDDSTSNYPERTLNCDKFIEPSDYILNYSLGASQRYIIKHEYLLKHKLVFFTGILHEDGEFGPRLVAHCNYIYLLAQPVYHYYQRATGSIMSSWKLKNSEDLIKISKMTQELAGTISDKKIRDSIIYASFRTAMYAFKGKKKKENKEIKLLYKKTIPFLRETAFKAIFAKGIGVNKRILALASILSPALYYKLKK